jgi:hypothetical protein
MDRRTGRQERKMARVVFRQTVESTDDLLARWPNPEPAVTVERITVGLAATRSRLEESNLDLRADEPTAADALELYNAVIADGRYLDELIEDPQLAADRLGQRVSSEAADLLRRAMSLEPGLGLVRELSRGRLAITVFIAIVILAADQPAEEVVIDDSGLVKF